MGLPEKIMSVRIILRRQFVLCRCWRSGDRRLLGRSPVCSHGSHTANRGVVAAAVIASDAHVVRQSHESPSFGFQFLWHQHSAQKTVIRNVVATRRNGAPRDSHTRRQNSRISTQTLAKQSSPRELSARTLTICSRLESSTTLVID